MNADFKALDLSISLWPKVILDAAMLTTMSKTLVLYLVPKRLLCVAKGFVLQSMYTNVAVREWVFRDYCIFMFELNEDTTGLKFVAIGVRSRRVSDAGHYLNLGHGTNSTFAEREYVIAETWKYAETVGWTDVNISQGHVTILRSNSCLGSRRIFCVTYETNIVAAVIEDLKSLSIHLNQQWR